MKKIIKKTAEATVNKSEPDYGDASIGKCTICAEKIIDTHDGNIYSISDCPHYPAFK